jgi:hypothetical protein
LHTAMLFIEPRRPLKALDDPERLPPLQYPIR